MPLLLERHGYDKFLAGGFMSIYALVGLLLSAPLGLALQRIGIRRMVLPVVVLFAAGSLIAIVTPDSGVLLLLGRGLEGVAFTVCAIAGPVIAIGAASHRHVPIVVGLYATWIPAGQLFALAFAVPSVGADRWQPLWWIGLAATGVVGLAVLFFSRPVGERDTRANTQTPAPPAPIPSGTQTAPLILVAGIFSLWSAQMFALLTWLPQYLVEVWAMDAAGAIAPYAIPPALILVFNVVGGLLLRRGWPLAPLLAASLALQSLVWFALPALDGVAMGVIGLILFGIGGGITPACLFAAPNAISGHGSGGSTAFGLIMTGRNLGVFAGPILVPLTLAQVGSWSFVGPVFGGIALAAALSAVFLGLLLRRREMIAP
jgi:predicted MFS family arabinose efflux permease